MVGGWAGSFLQPTTNADTVEREAAVFHRRVPSPCRHDASAECTREIESEGSAERRRRACASSGASVGTRTEDTESTIASEPAPSAAQLKLDVGLSSGVVLRDMSCQVFYYLSLWAQIPHC